MLGAVVLLSLFFVQTSVFASDYCRGCLKEPLDNHQWCPDYSSPISDNEGVCQTTGSFCEFTPVTLVINCPTDEPSSLYQCTDCIQDDYRWCSNPNAAGDWDGDCHSLLDVCLAPQTPVYVEDKCPDYEIDLGWLGMAVWMFVAFVLILPCIVLTVIAIGVYQVCCRRRVEPPPHRDVYQVAHASYGQPMLFAQQQQQAPLLYQAPPPYNPYQYQGQQGQQ